MLPNDLDKPSWEGIEPYRTKPLTGSVAHRYLQRLRDRGDWVPTRDLYDIYRDDHGGHVNVLIKLAKSDYIDSKKDEVELPAKDKSGIMLPRKFICRSWKIAHGGLNYLEKYDVTAEEMMEKTIARITRYLTKKGVTWEIVDGSIRFALPLGHEDKVVTYDLEDLATKSTMWQKIYFLFSCTRYREKPEDAQAYADAEDWIKAHSGLVTSVVTPIGTIALVGDVRSNYMTLNNDRICIVSNQPVHHADMYICRLQWLNSDLDHLMKLIVRGVILKSCPNCGYKPQYGSLFQDEWNFCPCCASPIDPMIQAHILHRR